MGSSRSAVAPAWTRPRRPTCTPPTLPTFSRTSTRPSARASRCLGPLRPLIAIPTTTRYRQRDDRRRDLRPAGDEGQDGHISHRSLRPVMGIVDPDNVRDLPSMVTACSGFDVLSHGLESYTAMPFGLREAPENPGLRPSYQGSNPISDVWALKAIEMVAENMHRAVHDPDDAEARGQMLLAANVRGSRFRQRGLSPAARHVVSGVGHGEGLRSGRLSSRGTHRPPRHVGDPQRSRCVPLHRPDQP